MPRYFCVLLIFFLFVAGYSLAAKPVVASKQKAVLKTDSAIVKVRNFNGQAIANYRRQPEFKYLDNEMQITWWGRFWIWFWHLVKQLFSFLLARRHSKGFFQVIILILEYLGIILGVAAIVFFILKLIGIDAVNIFRRKPVAAGLAHAEFLENIHEINFDDEIERAIHQQNYRLAVRLLYLKCLKQLSDLALIKWQPEKTNSAYADELDNTEQKNAFKQLTRQFEYIWYGEFPIDGYTFKNINGMFQQFKNGIS